MDKYRIDTHKLIYHPERVSDWLKNKNVYPIYAEISPSGACNHRCSYCALDFMEYKPRFLDAKMLKVRFKEMAGLGLKSLMFAGEGEPFLHPDMAAISVHANKCGIDTSFTTNAVLMKPAVIDRILPTTSWIKVSISGGTPVTYSQIHRCGPGDFATVFSNLGYAAALKKKKGYSCTLGMQMVLLPENAHEAVELARKARDAGMDYLVIKPYSQHPLSVTDKYRKIRYASFDKLATELEKINRPGFSVIFRQNTMRKWDEGRRPYARCLALPFWTYIDAGGNVWGCSMFLQNEKFRYGNINERTFRQIWEGNKRRRSLACVRKMDATRCRVNCRMDEINRYLWELRSPAGHSNFI
ncbi:MAG: radical SAM protein [Elusimicrobia bacterium RIFOXYA2_FULL_58_8]|nr:MAG: radical SAM protein [Elusimicrobia bacterium RIFOXYA12_FULL_57_11]OGS16149.1 MAG: radical SAM protein [Elusimicrobia bacterium RIFOXYA2_FULL_58_8]